MTKLNCSFWLESLDQPINPDQDLPQRADVAVIGGGITGVSAAYWLSQLGLLPVVLERGQLSGGATGRNGGHFVLGANQNFRDSVASIGLDETLALWDFTRHNTDLLRQLVDQHGIDCDLRFNQIVSLTTDPAVASTLQQTYGQMAAHGLASEYWDRPTVAEKTQSQAFLGGIVEPEHAQLWPAKLVLGIAKAAQQQGAHLHPHTLVQTVTRQSSHFEVATSRGSLQADAVIYATNAWAYHLLSEVKGVIMPIRGQVIATAPAPPVFDFDWLVNGGYEYAIQRADGRIILGGMRRRSPSNEIGIEDDSTLEPRVSEGLREFLGGAFPHLRHVPIDYEWTGIMGYTPDDNPLVGALPNRPGEYISAGYTGHGMAVAIGAARALAAQIAGSTAQPLPQAFRPNRFLLTASG